MPRHGRTPCVGSRARPTARSFSFRFLCWRSRRCDTVDCRRSGLGGRFFFSGAICNIAWSGPDRRARGGGGPGIEKPPDRIVTDGAYRYVRNPMYLGHLIFMAGTGGHVVIVARACAADLSRRLVLPSRARRRTATGNTLRRILSRVYIAREALGSRRALIE